MTPEELLARFKPQLRYDSQEAFFADSAEQMTANPGNELRRAGGEVLARAGDGLSLSFLGPTYPSGEVAEPEDVLGITGRDYRTQYSRLREARPELRNRIYGHAKEDGGGRLWLQYWLWYLYNDYHLAADFGLHEGDWEMVQLRLSGEEPEAAVYAQHAYAEMRPWDEVEKTDDGRPVVYPGRGSHASYFAPGLHETQGWFDIADGRRDTPDLELEILRDDDPPWVVWPGFWGDTKKRFFLEDESPTGPGAHLQWTDPAWLEGKVLVLASSRPPAPPELEAVRAHGLLQLRFDFTAHQGGEPVRLVATVNSADEHGVPPRTFTYGIEGMRKGSFDTHLALDGKKHYDIYTSVTFRVDGQELPSSSRLTLIAPRLESAVPEWLKRPVWWLQRLLSRR